MTRPELRRSHPSSARRRSEDEWARLSYALLGTGALCLAAAAIGAIIG